VGRKEKNRITELFSRNQKQIQTPYLLNAETMWNSTVKITHTKRTEKIGNRHTLAVSVVACYNTDFYINLEEDPQGADRRNEEEEEEENQSSSSNQKHVVDRGSVLRHIKKHTNENKQYSLKVVAKSTSSSSSSSPSHTKEEEDSSVDIKIKEIVVASSGNKKEKEEDEEEEDVQMIEASSRSSSPIGFDKEKKNEKRGSLVQFDPQKKLILEKRFEGKREIEANHNKRSLMPAAEGDDDNPRSVKKRRKNKKKNQAEEEEYFYRFHCDDELTWRDDVFLSPDCPYSFSREVMLSNYNGTRLKGTTFKDKFVKGFDLEVVFAGEPIVLVDEGISRVSSLRMWLYMMKFKLADSIGYENFFWVRRVSKKNKEMDSSDDDGNGIHQEPYLCFLYKDERCFRHASQFVRPSMKQSTRGPDLFTIDIGGGNPTTLPSFLKN
jgi:hypothetical protein